MIEVTDSGFTPENIADAEWLWTNLPTFPRNWSSLPTHEKALIVHTAARLRIEAAKAERDRLRDIANSPALEIAARKTGHGALTIAVIAPALADALESQP